MSLHQRLRSFEPYLGMGLSGGGKIIAANEGIADIRGVVFFEYLLSKAFRDLYFVDPIRPLDDFRGLYIPPPFDPIGKRKNRVVLGIPSADLIARVSYHLEESVFDEVFRKLLHQRDEVFIFPPECLLEGMPPFLLEVGFFIDSRERRGSNRTQAVKTITGSE